MCSSDVRETIRVAEYVAQRARGFYSRVLSRTHTDVYLADEIDENAERRMRTDNRKTSDECNNRNNEILNAEECTRAFSLVYRHHLCIALAFSIGERVERMPETLTLDEAC